jgi:hypothetical protein
MVVPVAGDRTGEVRLATTPFLRTRSKTTFVPVENWILAHDGKTGEYVGQVFDRTVLSEAGLWQDTDFFTMELSSGTWTLNPGEKKMFGVTYRIGQGTLSEAVTSLRELCRREGSKAGGP